MLDVLAPELYEVLKPAVADALTVIRAVVESGGFIAKHYRYPTFSYFVSGVVHLSTYGDSGPVEYSSALRPHGKPRPSFPSWDAAIDTLSSNFRLREYHHWNSRKEDSIFSPQSEVEYLIGRLAERYIHTSGKMELDDLDFLPVYREWEAGVFLPTLPFDIVVPIIFVEFNVDQLSSLSGAFSIERMSESLQLARAESLQYANDVNATVAGGASHALVLENWQIENRSWPQVVGTLGSAEAFAEALPIIDRFFSALRVETACETGYSQIVIRPRGWALRWTADLPEISTFTVREYPDRFDAHGWLRPPCHVELDQATATLELCDALSAVNQNKLALACNRLNRSYLRRDEVDSILDITIALETLVADDSHGELAYRLAMRMGALAGQFAFGGYTPQQVFQLCKRVYDYRSSVVHGARGSEKKRLIREHSKSEPVPAITVGLSILRYAIKALATQPHLLDAKAIDALLLGESSLGLLQSGPGTTAG